MGDFIFLAIETYGCFHSHFDSFFITYAQIIIECHQQSFLIPLVLVSYYQKHLSIALQCVQAITIFQQATTFGQGSSSFSHIIVSAPPSLTNMWQTTILLS
jgi:hypothetical protein